MVNFLKEFNIEAAEMCNRVANNEWKYATNATEYNKRRVKEQQSVATKFECLSWRRAQSFINYAIANSNVKRQLQRIIKQGKCGLTDEKYAEINSLIQQMTDNYKHARVCPYRGTQSEVVNQSTQMGENVGVVPITQNETVASSQSENYVTHTYTGFCDLSIDNDIPRIMEQSRNEAELKYIWSAWHEKTGPPNRNNFMRYIDLDNQAATAHGFSDAGEQMRALYEDPEMYFTVQDLWAQIQPLYRQLFTYVRKGLIRQYGEKIIRPDGPIPAHLLGNGVFFSSDFSMTLYELDSLLLRKYVGTKLEAHHGYCEASLFGNARCIRRNGSARLHTASHFPKSRRIFHFTRHGADVTRILAQFNFTTTKQ